VCSLFKQNELLVVTIDVFFLKSLSPSCGGAIYVLEWLVISTSPLSVAERQLFHNSPVLYILRVMTILSTEDLFDSAAIPAPQSHRWGLSHRHS